MKRQQRKFALAMGVIGGLVLSGFLIVDELENGMEWVIGTLAAIAAMTFTTSLIQTNRLKRLALAKEGLGADEGERLVSIRMSHMMDWLMASLIASLVGFGLSAMYMYIVPTWLIFGFGAFFVGQLIWMPIVTKRLTKLTHPDRDWPKDGDLLSVMDEGEKYMMYEGMTSGFQVVMAALLFGMIVTIFYSVWTDIPQTFAFVAMAIIYLMGQWSYQRKYRQLEGE